MCRHLCLTCLIMGYVKQLLILKNPDNEEKSGNEHQCYHHYSTAITARFCVQRENTENGNSKDDKNKELCYPSGQIFFRHTIVYDLFRYDIFQ